MLLKLYDCPMLISDIDAVYRAPIRQTLPDLNDLDVGLYVKKRQISRSSLADNPSGDPDIWRANDLWFIDQNMLYHV